MPRNAWTTKCLRVLAVCIACTMPPLTVAATDGTASQHETANRGTVARVAPAIRLSPVLPGALQGRPYSQHVSASGGAFGYTFAVTAGVLPAGLVLGIDGSLAGTPSVAGEFRVTVTATDAHGFSGSQEYSFRVSPSPTLRLSPDALPAAEQGRRYSHTLQASGSTLVYSYAVTAGELPPGMTLSSSGVLSGTPQAPGAFRLTATASDPYGYTVSREYTLAVGSAQSASRSPEPSPDVATTPPAASQPY